jgi:hypothetical protein
MRFRAFRRPALAGYVDHFDKHVVRGWAWDAAEPVGRIQLDVFVRGIFLGQTRTGILRPDLLHLGLGDGRHGFLFHIPENARQTGVEQSHLSVITSAPERIVLAMPGGAHGTEHPVAFERQNDVNAFFAPLLEAIGFWPNPQSNMPHQGGRRRQIDSICDSSANSTISAFTTHIAQKYERAGPADDAAGFWTWYLGDYASEKGLLRAPLSVADIQTLITCDSRGLSRSANLFAANRPQRSSRLQNHYWWAVEESRRLFVEDCLVDAASVNVLQRISPIARLTSFPLSRFMHSARQHNAILKNVRNVTETDRQIIYVLIMLLALRSPHYLAYMPKRWLCRMLEGSAQQSIFERTIVRTFGESCRMDSARYYKSIEAQGFDVASQTFSGTRYRGHRVFGGAAIVCGRARVDVQIIGPFRRTLGLGESCRRIANALLRRRCQFEPGYVG